jgi:CRP-like cAMP-binding protein
VLTLDAGDVLIHEGTRTGSLYVLESGSLAVLRGDIAVAKIDHAGAVIGEVALLLGHEHAATVEAMTASSVRFAQDGEQFLREHPEATLLIAAELATRLDTMNRYLADLQTQYGGAPGLAMVQEVLAKLSDHKATPFEPGSDREPDPHY